MAAQNIPSLSQFFKMAVMAGVESAVRIHIARGDDLNARDDSGQTPLMLAARRNRAAICKLLMDAGADVSLVDPSGRTAFGIAEAAGACEAASVIATASGLLTNISNDVEDLCAVPVIAHVGDAKGMDGQSTENNQKRANLDSSRDQDPVYLGSRASGETEVTTELTVDADQDSDAFNLSGWEPEEEQAPPKNDPTLAEAALGIQSAISDYQPIDTSSDWEDIEVYFPDQASPLRGSEDAEVRERLRLVMLRAIREGSVPDALIEDLSLDDKGLPNEEACALLRMVINDLGAETDERFEYVSPDENYVVTICPEETADEEDLVASAIAFIDDLATRRNEPFHFYQKEMQREALLDATAEVALAQAMERGVEKALDALASWELGIKAVLDSARKVKSGEKPFGWMSSGADRESKDIDASLNSASASDFDTASEGVREDDESDSQFDPNAKESIDEMSEFFAQVEHLSNIGGDSKQNVTNWNVRRNALTSLNLTRGFLLELVDAGLHVDQENGLAFIKAMKAYRLARDRMAVANLKLVFSIAKKYLFSGQPLDDLLQEGNIGLLKAVDRYDWRKGFKFSTYATWWIRQQIGRYIADKSKTIRLPVHVYNRAQQIAQIMRTLELQSGRTPAIHEVAVTANLSTDKVASLVRANLDPLPVHELDVDRIIAIEAQDEFTAIDPMDSFEKRQLIGTVDRFLRTLKPKEESILRMRFGIGIQESMTLEEVGKKLDVTRERIRQIEAQTIRLLRIKLENFFREFSSAPPTAHDEATDQRSKSVGLRTASAVSTAITSKQPRPLSKTSPKSEQVRSPKQSVLDRILEDAMMAGVTVHDDREGQSQKIWVRITGAPDARSRKLVRKLVASGFEFWPGKGYWK